MSVSQSQIIKAVQRVLYICERLEVPPRHVVLSFTIMTSEGVSDSALSEISGIPRRTVRRFTSTKSSQGILEKNASGYVFTPEYKDIISTLFIEMLEIAAGQRVALSTPLEAALRSDYGRKLGVKLDLNPIDLTFSPI